MPIWGQKDLVYSFYCSKTIKNDRGHFLSNFPKHAKLYYLDLLYTSLPGHAHQVHTVDGENMIAHVQQPTFGAALSC